MPVSFETSVYKARQQLTFNPIDKGTPPKRSGRGIFARKLSKKLKQQEAPPKSLGTIQLPYSE